MTLPAVPSRHLVHLRSGGALHGLRPVPDENVAQIATEYPGISTAYLAFITQIGVGSCDAGHIYLPVAVEELVDHQSYKLYRSRALRSLFPASPLKPFPLGAVMIADTGASWKYCFGAELGETIYSFDLADAALNQSHVSFESLIDEWLADRSDNAQPNT